MDWTRVRLLVLAALLALMLAVVGAYLVVISQNPASSVTGPSVLYGSISP